MKKHNLKFFYPNFFNNKAISYACLSIAKHMAGSFNTTVMGISSTNEVRVPFYKNAIPTFFGRIAYRFFSNLTLHRFAEYRFEKTVNSNDIVYLWPGTSVSLFIKLKNKGCTIVRENINTHTAYAKKVLDTEYSNSGVSGYHVISDSMIQQEIEIQAHTDFVFSPSPLVSESLRDSGVSSESILEVSYGLNQSEILPYENTRSYKENGYVTAIFVGRICVRKGVHLLLDAWEKANINGRLLLIGAIDDNIAELVDKHLSDSVQHIPYVNDLKPVYRDADFFVLPSIEEGSPLVTYLALGAGLPSIVSPMGGGGLITDNEGFVIDPHDHNAWTDAIRTLANDGELRRIKGDNAYAKAREYTWDKVGERRAKALKEKLLALNT